MSIQSAPEELSQDRFFTALEALINRAEAKEVAGLARLLTCLENEGPRCLQHPKLLSPTTAAFRIGLTGPPGSGKSTLTGQMIKQFRKKGLSLAVLAIDPSSPFTKGAILGDRIRYTEFADDPGVFIRSVGTRGSLGGLSSATYLMLRALDIYGFDMVIVETVGVGQTELEIINVADFIAVVLVPESGDSIQIMKAGLMEIADGFIVNKSDRPGATQMLREIQAQYPAPASSMTAKENNSQKNGGPSRLAPKAFATIATEGKGIGEIVAHLEELASLQNKKSQQENLPRLQREAHALLRGVCETEVAKRVNNIKNLQDFSKLWQPPC